MTWFEPATVAQSTSRLRHLHKPRKKTSSSNSNGPCITNVPIIKEPDRSPFCYFLFNFSLPFHWLLLVFIFRILSDDFTLDGPFPILKVLNHLNWPIMPVDDNIFPPFIFEFQKQKKVVFCIVVIGCCCCCFLVDKRAAIEAGHRWIYFQPSAHRIEGRPHTTSAKAAGRGEPSTKQKTLLSNNKRSSPFLIVYRATITQSGPSSFPYFCCWCCCCWLFRTERAWLNTHGLEDETSQQMKGVV